MKWIKKLQLIIRIIKADESRLLNVEDALQTEPKRPTVIFRCYWDWFNAELYNIPPDHDLLLTGEMKNLFCTESYRAVFAWMGRRTPPSMVIDKDGQLKQ